MENDINEMNRARAACPGAGFVRPHTRARGRRAGRPAAGVGLRMARLPRFAFFKAREGYGAIFIRVLIGAFIVWGVQDNILSFERMEEFAQFLAARGVPLPLFA